MGPFARRLALRAVVALACCTASATAADDAPLPFVVVVNTANPVQVMTIQQLRRVFTRQERLWSHGDAIVPVDWDASKPIRRDFSRRVLGRTVREVSEFWVEKSVTQGLTPPSTLSSSVAILRFVASVPGAVAYLPVGAADATVKRVRIEGVR